ncbi:hypothetical protein I6N91_10610 [Arthrobacter sp. MSA 4-2]|uniref:hypothetical protein n=1 Tax=Arthrobacter sp. MSA 4-2 TaxID=2794349 RepID=UPI0018E78B12|nr:hypothetical protein [Arthrobacter sp. MSA 4-2]MBJ2121430.1 hypothetical protein [Arthrobacter sp. MSA 4-2]
MRGETLRQDRTGPGQNLILNRPEEVGVHRPVDVMATSRMTSEFLEQIQLSPGAGLVPVVVGELMGAIDVFLRDDHDLAVHP